MLQLFPGGVLGAVDQDTSFTEGSVLFRGSSVISENNAKFFWDDTNEWLKIGGVDPLPSDVSIKLVLGGERAKLQIRSTLANRFSAIQVLNSSDDNCEYLVYGRSASSTYFGLPRAGLAVLGGSPNSAFAIGTRTAKPLVFATNDLERVRILSNGMVGFLTQTAKTVVDINSDIFRLRTAKTPASTGATGFVGSFCWDSGFLYICVATDTWKRAELVTW